mmetsp:Transcript_8999/g.26966  ORF Transcript_8999/g.26966 Transcript_8999/m.26966 type:complete len:85 (-) Transcript_8999:3189-3443(-)
MSFFGKVFSYVFNEALVQGLANSKTFQRFAVRSSKIVEELQSKGTTHKERLTSQASEFSKTFREEMKKGMDQQFSGKDGPQGRR